MGGNRGRIRATGALALCGLATLAATSMAGAAAPAFGGASGSVASISGTSMEVQNPSAGQTTVNWTSTTSFTKTVTLSVSSITSGECLSIVGTPSKKSKTTLAARTITEVAASATGTCPSGAGGRAFGAGGPGGARPFGAGAAGGFTARPGGAGGGGGSFAGGQGGGRTTRGRGFFGGTSFGIGSGKVTSVSGSTLTLSGYLLNQTAKPAQSKSKKNTKAPKLKAEKFKITTSKTTTVSQTQTTSASALAVKDCVTTFGSMASSGAVTATTVRITATNATTCSTGFGGGFGGGGFGGPGPVAAGGGGGG